MPEITPEFFNAAEKIVQAYGTAESLNIPVNSQTIGRNDDTIIYFDKRKFSQILIAIENNVTTATLGFEISGVLDEVADPATIDDGKWSTLPSGVGSTETVETRSITDNWSWIRIQLKKNTSTNTTANIKIRANSN